MKNRVLSALLQQCAREGTDTGMGRGDTGMERGDTGMERGDAGMGSSGMLGWGEGMLEWRTGMLEWEQELLWGFKERGRVRILFQSGQGGYSRGKPVPGVCFRRRQLPELCQAGSGPWQPQEEGTATSPRAAAAVSLGQDQGAAGTVLWAALVPKTTQEGAQGVCQEPLCPGLVIGTGQAGPSPWPEPQLSCQVPPGAAPSPLSGRCICSWFPLCCTS